MDATDELHRLLDERGVEYKDRNVFGKHVFHWGKPFHGAMFTDAGEWTELVVENATPKQAIEATLGSDLKTENEKLRELVRALDWHIRTDGLCADCPLGLAPDAPYEVMCDVMIEELGMGVDA